MEKTISEPSKLKRTLTIICLILAGEAVFFLPFVLARIFRPTFLNAFHINNLELGTCFSVYGIIGMISYFFGGALADKFPSRNLIAFGLWSTGIGGIVMALFPSYTTLMILYAYWGITTIFLLWAALIRATREWGTEQTQGKAFGFLEGGRGLAAASLGTLTLLLFSNTNSEETQNTSIQNASTFLWIVAITSIVTILCGILVWLFVPKQVMKLERNKTSLKIIIDIIKKPGVWLQSIIIICAYVGYKITDDYSLYANQVLDFTEIESAKVGTGALWARPVFAVIAGLLADRLKGSKVVIWCFVLMFIGGVFVYLGWFQHYLLFTFILLLTSLVGIYGIRSIYFALMGESKIPLTETGTAVGIMSVIGYTPDIFMSTTMGYLLDRFPGATGHQYVFMVFAVFAFIGFLASLAFRRIPDQA